MDQENRLDILAKQIELKIDRFSTSLIRIAGIVLVAFISWCSFLTVTTITHAVAISRLEDAAADQRKNGMSGRELGEFSERFTTLQQAVVELRTMVRSVGDKKDTIPQWLIQWHSDTNERIERLEKGQEKR